MLSLFQKTQSQLLGVHRNTVYKWLKAYSRVQSAPNYHIPSFFVDPRWHKLDHEVFTWFNERISSGHAPTDWDLRVRARCVHRQLFPEMKWTGGVYNTLCNNINRWFDNFKHYHHIDTVRSAVRLHDGNQHKAGAQK